MTYEVFLLFVVFSTVSSVEIKCKYYDYDWNDWGGRYTCSATLRDVIKPGIEATNVTGQHLESLTNADVRGVEFHGQKTFYLIRGLTHFFPNITDLYVFRSDLRRISRSDLASYHNQLRTLSLSRNRINFVPKDAFDDANELEYLSLSFNALTAVPNLKALKNLRELYLFENSIEALLATDFESNEKLEVIWLYHNKIQYIDPAGVFDYATKLKYADLTNNRCIDLKYYGDRENWEFKEIIKSNKCMPELLEDRLYDTV